ncbi:hypothetical protein IC229_29600 [Spirosoma sp. BT702]|uniref:Uncharacterized protein n=1 Tax=Spirosoma profusum TaxID=2771354 RepID=A0A927AUU3_9BACT|nr:hypothetical protein [Spirosoma profusum]MBD2704823.1 hypothetical protein [Spirosoma profusum]
MNTEQLIDPLYFDTERVKHEKKIESYFRNENRWNTVFRYLLVEFSPYKDFFAQVEVHDFNWNGDGEWVLLLEKSSRKHCYRNQFIASAKLKFFDNTETHEPIEIAHVFELRCEYQCDLDNEDSIPTLEIFNSKRQLLKDYNDYIFQFYKDQKLHDDTFVLNNLSCVV